MKLVRSVILGEAAKRNMRGRAPSAVQAERQFGRSGLQPNASALITLFFLLLTSLASAATLTGTVKNGTTGKPSVGDDVVLLNLSQGMEEAARTKTDAKGNFSFNLADTGAPHLVRVVHQGVTYHRMAPPGTTSTDIQVFDVAKRVDGVTVTADVMRIQAENNQLEVIRLFAVNNQSSPPRTQMNDHNFEFYLPEGAQVDEAMAMTAGGQPVKSAPVPQSEKNRYAFVFPLRPGDTQLQIAYHFLYSGEATLDPKSLYPLEHFVVMLPKSMKFSASPGSPFETKPYPNQPDTLAEIASNTKAGQSLSFKLSGTGILQTERQAGGGGQSGGEDQVSGTMAQGRDSRPGGGLGPPIDAPDPLQKYRWYILGGFAAVLALGAFYVATRQQSSKARVGLTTAADFEIPSGDTPRIARPASNGRSAMLLEALKEELFQLEVEHKQGRISQQEYEKARAALDQTLERAIKRESQKTK